MTNKQSKTQANQRAQENQEAGFHASNAVEQPASNGSLLPRDGSLALQMIAGFGLLLCFITMQSLMGSKLPSLTMSLGYAPLIIQRCLEAITFLAAALLSSRVQQLAGHTLLMWTCSAALIVEVIIEGVTVLGVLPFNGAVLSHLAYCIVGSIAPGILWMAWIELYARLDIRRVTLLFLGANVLQALLTLLMSLQALSAIVLTFMVALPLLSVVLLVRASKRLRGLDSSKVEPGPAPVDSGAVSTTSFPLAPVCLMATFTLANVFARDMLPVEDRPWATVGVLACLVVLAVTFRRSGMRFNLWPLCAVAFPLTLAGLFGLLLTSPAWGIPATLLTHAGETLFGVFITVVLCNVAFRYGTNALYLFGITKAVGSISALAGALLAFRGSPWEHDALILLIAGMALALTVCYIALSWKKTGEITWGVDEESATTRETVHATNGAFETSIQAICSKAAFEYGLTRREEEVLGLLMQDMTAQQIEDTLCVSNSTVKSHTHAVYQKIDVHSRSELIEKLGAPSRP